VLLPPRCISFQPASQSVSQSVSQFWPQGYLFSTSMQRCTRNIYCERDSHLQRKGSFQHVQTSFSRKRTTRFHMLGKHCCFAIPGRVLYTSTRKLRRERQRDRETERQRMCACLCLCLCRERNAPALLVYMSSCTCQCNASFLLCHTSISLSIRSCMHNME
jgi:hypothetical protein